MSNRRQCRTGPCLGLEASSFEAGFVTVAKCLNKSYWYYTPDGKIAYPDRNNPEDIKCLGIGPAHAGVRFGSEEDEPVLVDCASAPTWTLDPVPTINVLSLDGAATSDSTPTDEGDMGGDMDGGDMPVTLPATVVDIAKMNENFTTLVDAVMKAGIAPALMSANDTSEPFYPWVPHIRRLTPAEHARIAQIDLFLHYSQPRVSTLKKPAILVAFSIQ